MFERNLGASGRDDRHRAAPDGRMTRAAGDHRRATAGAIGLFVTMLVLLDGATPAMAATRYAVPGGGMGDVVCTSPAAGCSLAEVLENVVATGDEVIVMPGNHDAGSMGVYVRSVA